jgi:hypothetical protein
VRLGTHAPPWSEGPPPPRTVDDGPRSAPSTLQREHPAAVRAAVVAGGPFFLPKLDAFAVRSAFKPSQEVVIRSDFTAPVLLPADVKQHLDPLASPLLRRLRFSGDAEDDVRCLASHAASHLTAHSPTAAAHPTASSAAQKHQ